MRTALSAEDTKGQSYPPVTIMKPEGNLMIHQNETHLYTAPSGITRPATIDAVDGELAFISYFIQDSDIEMTGWVLLTDLTPLAKTAALVGDVQTINEEIALDDEYSRWLDAIEAVSHE